MDYAWPAIILAIVSVGVGIFILFGDTSFLSTLLLLAALVFLDGAGILIIRKLWNDDKTTTAWVFFGIFLIAQFFLLIPTF